MAVQHAKPRRLLCAAAAIVSVLVVPVQAIADEEIAEIRQLIAEMKADYEQRLAVLEQRLALAEAKAARPSVERQTPTTQAGTVTSGNSYNPQISVVLDGNYYHDSISGEGAEVIESAAQPSVAPAHGHVHDYGQSNGFNIRSAELAFVATVDPYFDASVFLVLESGGEIEIEEAWFATRSLPGGLRVKGGQLLSEIGYLNTKHEHEWDFADQNLAYINLLGDHGLEDAGVQLTWLPELPFYTQVGTELLQGDQERVGTLVDSDENPADFGLGEQKSGPRLYTLFAKVSPDLGYDHALRLGASLVHSRQHQEIQSGVTGDVGLEGDADLWVLDAVYKYDDAAAWGHHDLSVTAEYLYSTKDLTVVGGDAGQIGTRRRFTTDGLYVQGVYGIAPRWQAGLRYDVLGLVNEARGDVRQSFESSDRWSTVLTWTPTEFSRFRLQYSKSDILTPSGLRENFESVWLQFLLTLGAHGAHQF